MRCEARFRATQVRASRAKGTSCGPRTGTRLATDGGPGTVTLTACHFPGGKPGPAVYEAIDHDLFKPGDAAAARAQVAKYGITKPFVVFVSSLWAYKNHGGLLRAGREPGLSSGAGSWCSWVRVLIRTPPSCGRWPPGSASATT
jgi:hypothetical protein